MGRISTSEDIYLVVSHQSSNYVPPKGAIDPHSFSFYAGTKEQLDKLHLLKSDIVSVRLCPLFLRSELKRFTNKEARRIGGIGYKLHDSILGKIAETNTYFPKANVDRLFSGTLHVTPQIKPEFELKGIGAYLEAVCGNYLKLNYGVTQFITPAGSSISRQRQLERGKLEKGIVYESKEWQKGLGRLIRRRTMPKRPL